MAWAGVRLSKLNIFTFRLARLGRVHLVEPVVQGDDKLNRRTERAPRGDNDASRGVAEDVDQTLAKARGVRETARFLNGGQERARAGTGFARQDAPLSDISRHYFVYPKWSADREMWAWLVPFLAQLT